jgi:acetyl esterase/lipase
MNVFDRTPPVADRRLPYGSGQQQFGDLWIPKGPVPGGGWPVVVFVHGGWWRSEYDLAHAGHLCAGLRAVGLVVWSVEYRRVGFTGGGWPETFQDVSAGMNHVVGMGREYGLDLTRVVAMGHSAGGQLAFWLAGRHHVPYDSPVAVPAANLGLRGVIALAGAVDLRLVCDLAGYTTFAHDKAEVYALMGGSPGQVPERYKAGNPGELLPLGVPQWLIQGTEDGQIPPGLPGRWADEARRQGDHVTVTVVAGADHFDLIDPESKAWPVVVGAVKAAVFG